MAIFRSSLLADVRGSIGGSVYSRNRSGAIIRNRTNPINPNTTAQSLVRVRFASKAAEFQVLDPAKQEGWATFAELVPSLNSLGESYTPTAKQRYIQSNLNLAAVGAAQVDSPTLGDTVAPSLDLSTVAPVATVTAGVLTALDLVALINAEGATHIVVQATPPAPSGVRSNRNQMRTMFAGAFTVNVDLMAAYEDVYNGGDPVPVVADQRINFRVRAVNDVNGLASAWYYLTTLVSV